MATSLDLFQVRQHPIVDTCASCQRAITMRPDGQWGSVVGGCVNCIVQYDPANPLVLHVPAGAP